MRRANGRANGRVGGTPRILRDIVKAFRRPHRFAHCRFACPTGTAASQGLSARGRTAHSFQTGRMACDVPHRHATRSWPKALGNRLYGSLSTRLGINGIAVDRRGDAGHVGQDRGGEQARGGRHRAAGTGRQAQGGRHRAMVRARMGTCLPWPGQKESPADKAREAS